MIGDQKRIRELEADLAELREFNTRSRANAEVTRRILLSIYHEHAPKVRYRWGEVGINLECSRCRTNESHSWGRYIPWPCPTLASFVSYAVYTPKEETADVAESPDA